MGMMQRSYPAADTTVLAHMGLKAIYRPNFKLSKAGVILMDLQSDQMKQGELDFGDAEDMSRVRLMSAMDALNDRFGRGAVFLASTGNKGDKRAWSMRKERRTPAYTTRLSDIPTATP